VLELERVVRPTATKRTHRPHTRTRDMAPIVAALAQRIAPALAFAHAAFESLEPRVDTLARWTSRLVTGADDHAVAHPLFAYFYISLACNAGILLASLLLSRRILGAARFDGMKPHHRVTWHTNLCTFWPAFAVTAYALPAVVDFRGNPNSFASEVSTMTSKGCGMSIGYMMWDLGVILVRWEDQLKAYGGAGALYLFIAHHVFSILLWPYALTRGLCAYDINYFLVSEVTNFNMSLRWILSALKMSDTTLYLVNGLGWIPLFLSVRVAVIPRLFASFVGSDWSVFTPAQRWVALLTLPIPSMLNLYWSKKIVFGALKFLTTGEEPDLKTSPAKKKKKRN